MHHRFRRESSSAHPGSSAGGFANGGVREEAFHLSGQSRRLARFDGTERLASQLTEPPGACSHDGHSRDHRLDAGGPEAFLPGRHHEDVDIAERPGRLGYFSGKPEPAFQTDL